MTTGADLIVVGAGLAGAAAAWAATARGLDVIVLEQFGAGHRNGSSHGSARIFRRAYPDPLYVRLTGQAGELWRRLQDEAGEALLTITGGLDFGALRDPELIYRVMTAGGVAAELLAEDAAAERWPQFDFTGVGPVTFHAEAGVLDPHATMAAALRLAADGGADIRFDTPVRRLEPGGAGGLAHTDDGTFTAPVIAVAAGGWVGPLLGGLIELPPLTVVQQQAFHFAPHAATDEPWPVAIAKDETDDFYSLPGGRDGEVPGAIKIGDDFVGDRITTAAGRDFKVDPSGRAHVLETVARRFPGLDGGRAVNEVTCLYTVTPSQDFILDRPGGGPFIVASPCSGHGAKFAPLLGEIIADLATGKPSPDERFTLAAHVA